MLIPTNPGASLPGSFSAGQVKIAVTGAAVQLPSHALSQGVIVTANVNNAGNVIVGPSGITNTADGTGNGAVVPPGGGVGVAVNNTNLIYINGTAGDWVSYAGS